MVCVLCGVLAQVGDACEKGGVMAERALDVDAFCAWLCQYQDEVVGQAGTWFWCPLAQWLSITFGGGVYGIDEGRYGRAHWDMCRWLPLPQWAVLFETGLVRRYAGEMVTGEQALDVLAGVEWRLSCWRKVGV